MIQIICIAFLIIWAFRTKISQSGAGFFEDAIFALLPAIISSGLVACLLFLIAGTFGVISK